jgi:hypothetical protein
MNTITELEIRQAAAAGAVDVRTIRKVLRGGHVRGLAGARALTALRNLGLVPPAAQSPTTNA